MSWVDEMPAEPGRYFYRNVRDHDYGLCLIVWDGGFVRGRHVQQPHLKIRSVCSFGRNAPPPDDWMNKSIGENGDYPGWSYGGDTKPENIQFWSEPLTGPDGIPALVSDRPPDHTPEAIAAAAAESEKQSKKHKRKEAKAKRARKKAIDTAAKDGKTLYECNDCSSLWDPVDLVIGKMRECSNCYHRFVEGEDGRTCPECNRPFTRVEEERPTCPNCYSGGEMPELTLLVDDGKRVE